VRQPEAEPRQAVRQPEAEPRQAVRLQAAGQQQAAVRLPVLAPLA
jgi:hypothetical protein